MQLGAYLQNRKRLQQENLVPPQDLFSTRTKTQPEPENKENLHTNRTRPSSQAKGSPQQIILQQRETILSLKKQLEQKLINQGFANFFKTMNSGDLQHIDIYMELCSIRPKLKQKEMTIKGLQTKLEDKAKEIDNLQQELLVFEQEVIHDKERYEQQFLKAVDAIRKSQEKITRLTDQLRKAQKNSQENEKYEQLKLLHDQIDKQRLGAVLKNKELHELNKDLQRRVKQFGSFELRHEQQIGQLRQAFQLQASKTRSDIIELQQVNRNLLIQLKHQQQQQKRLGEQLKAQSAKLGSLREQIRKQSQQKQQEQEYLSTQLQDKIRSLNQQLDEEHQRAISFQNKLRTVQRELKSEVQQLRRSLQTVGQESQGYKQSLNKVNLQNQRLQNQLKSINQRCVKLRNCLLNREEEIAQTRSDNIKKNQELVQFQDSCEALSQENQTLRQQLKFVSAELGVDASLVQLGMTQFKERLNQLILIDELKQEMISKFKVMMPKEALLVVEEYHSLMKQAVGSSTQDQLQQLGYKKRQIMIEIQGVVDDLTCRQSYIRNLELKYSQSQKQLQELKKGRRSERKEEKKETEAISRRDLLKKHLK